MIAAGELYFPKQIENPVFENQFFDGKKKKCIIVEISDEEYDICWEVAPIFWANRPGNEYTEGLLKTEDDPYKSVRIGLLGQMAFGKVFGEPVDLVYREKGDKYDNILGNKYKVDIKCSARCYGKAYIYRKPNKEKWIEINKDIYVFCYLKSDDKDNKKAIVVMVGYYLKQDVLNSPLRKSPRKKCTHYNHEAYFSNLFPIERLLNLKNKYFKHVK